MARCNGANSSRSCGVPSFFSKTVLLSYPGDLVTDCLFDIILSTPQITTVVLYLAAWQLCSDKSNNERNDATIMRNHEEEEKAC